MPTDRSAVHRRGRSHATILAVALTLLFVLTGNSVASAAPTLDAATVKQKLIKRGIGNGVKVREVDGREITGVLTGIRDDEFDVTPKGLLQPATVQYQRVVDVRNDGKSLAKKVGTGLAIGAGVYIVVVVVTFVVVIAVVASSK